MLQNDHTQKILILYTIFEDGKGHVLYGLLLSFYDYIHTNAQKK